MCLFFTHCTVNLVRYTYMKVSKFQRTVPRGRGKKKITIFKTIFNIYIYILRTIIKAAFQRISIGLAIVKLAIMNTRTLLL